MSIDRLQFMKTLYEIILADLNQIVDKVKMAYGPKGRPITIQNNLSEQVTTKEGMMIAKLLLSNNNLDGAGIKAIRPMLVNMTKEIGNGTITFFILTQSLFNQTANYVLNGADSVEFEIGFKKSLVLVLNHLKKMSESCKNQTATIQMDKTNTISYEDFLPGGGIALLNSQKILENLQYDNPDQEKGNRVLWSALEAPIQQLILNADESPDIILENLKQQSYFGYDIITKSYGNMLEIGIIDSLKVTQTALKNAVGFIDQVIFSKHLSLK